MSVRVIGRRPYSGDVDAVMYCDAEGCFVGLPCAAGHRREAEALAALDEGGKRLGWVTVADDCHACPGCAPRVGVS